MNVHQRRVATFEEKGQYIHPELARLNRAFFRELERHEETVISLDGEDARDEVERRQAGWGTVT